MLTDPLSSGDQTCYNNHSSHGWRSPASNMFKTNGSTHHEGVANEHDTIALLNAHQVFAETLTHLGGTRNKADAMAGTKPVSIKHKAGLRNGSFDWVNTSQTDALLDSARFADFRAFVANARQWDEAKREEIVEETRDLFNEVCSDALDSIDPAALTEWLRSELIEANHGMAMAITDTKAATCYVMEHDTIRAARLLSEGYVAQVEKGRGMTSRKVTLRRDHHIVEVGLRLRVTSNNGIRAFLGLSKANRNSQVVLKLQQDRVDQLVAGSDDVRVIPF